MRKKIFATLMSVAMVASFMPSLAFATVTHVWPTSYSVDANGKVTGDDAKYVEVVKAPTCTAKGSVKLACKTEFCDEVETREVAALEHHSEKVVMTAADYVNAKTAQKETPAKAQKELEAKYCTVTVDKCKTCGYVGDLASAQDEHQKPSNVPACATSYVCTKCAATVKNEGAAAHTHDSTTEKVVSAADCGHAEVIEGTCSVCKEKYTRTGTAAKGDCQWTKTITPSNTKTVDGAKTYFDGTTAIATIKDGKVVGSATPGYKVDTTYDTPVFYMYDKVVKEATCTTDKVVGFTCKKCGKVEEVTLTGVKGHDWETKEIAATCTAPAQEYKVCKKCGKYKKNETAVDTLAEATKTPKAGSTKLGHKYVVEKVAATCEAAASYKVVCPVCKDVKTVLASEFTKDQSKWLNTKTGVVGDVKGADCVELPYIENTYAPHKYTKRVVLKEATCESPAKVGYKCDNCGKINAHGTSAYAVTENGAALGHDHPVVKVAATCVNKAYEAKAEECTRCGKVDPAIVDANKKAAAEAAIKGGKHSFDKWVVTKEATVFEEGVKELHCSKCDAAEGTKTVVAKKTVGKPVVKLTSTKGKMTVKASADNATGYKVTYKRVGKKAVTKTYTAESISKTYKLLKGKKYTVTVTAFASNGTETVTGAAVTKKITIKK